MDFSNIDLSPLWQALIIGAAGVVTLVFAAVGMAIRTWLVQKAGLTEAQLSQVDSAIYNVRLLKGISFAETMLGKDASKLKAEDINDFVTQAASYVRDNWPDMINGQSLSQDDIEKHVIARLPTETSLRADAAQTIGAATPAAVPVPVIVAAKK